MHFLIWETLSFNLIYVAACYLVGTGMCHNMVGLLQHYINLVELMSQILHAKFQDHRSSDPVEDDFYHTLAWRSF